MLCFLQQRGEKVFDSVQVLEVSAGDFGSPKPLLCFPSAEGQEEQGRLVNVFELTWFVSSYHHERAEVLCPVTCLTAWWRSLWSAQVSYRKLLLACGLGALLGLPHLNRGSLSTSLALCLGGRSCTTIPPISLGCSLPVPQPLAGEVQGHQRRLQRAATEGE